MKPNFHLLFSVFILILLSCNQGREKKSSPTDATIDSTISTSTPQGKYQLKSGIITLVSETMGMKQYMTTYFDDYGLKECIETKGVMNMGTAGIMEIHSLSFVKDTYYYTIDLISKTGTRTKISSSKNKNDINFNNLSEEQLKEMKLTRQGTETILNRICEKYGMNDSTLHLKSTYSVWKGFPLKSVIDLNGIKAIISASSIEENCSIPKEKFEIPADIKISEL